MQTITLHHEYNSYTLKKKQKKNVDRELFPIYINYTSIKVYGFLTIVAQLRIRLRLSARVSSSH